VAQVQEREASSEQRAAKSAKVVTETRREISGKINFTSIHDLASGRVWLAARLEFAGRSAGRPAERGEQSRPIGSGGGGGASASNNLAASPSRRTIDFWRPKMIHLERAIVCHCCGRSGLRNTKASRRAGGPASQPARGGSLGGRAGWLAGRLARSKAPPRVRWLGARLRARTMGARLFVPRRPECERSQGGGKRALFKGGGGG